MTMSPAELARRAAADAADAARKDYYRSVTNAGQAWQPTTRASGTPEPGGTPLLEKYEDIWARELMLATPSPINSHTIEHFNAVKADIDRRRAELVAKAQEIASRKPQI